MVSETNSQHPEGLSADHESLIMAMYDLDAIRFGDYKWKVHKKNPQAPLLPIYTNFRMLPGKPEAKATAVDIYQGLAAGLKFDLLAGIPTAATPFVASLSDRLSIGHITPRMDSKNYGSGATVDAFKDEDRGKTAAVFDDLKSFFDSKDQALKVLRGVDLVVTDVVVFMDYELGSPDVAERHNVRLHRAFTARQMLDFSMRIGEISPAKHAEVDEKFSIAQDYFKHDL